MPSHAVITGADLYIENLNKSYNGTYRCTAANALGESFDDYVLYVYGGSELRRVPPRPAARCARVTPGSRGPARAGLVLCL